MPTNFELLIYLIICQVELDRIRIVYGGLSQRYGEDTHGINRLVFHVLINLNYTAGDTNSWRVQQNCISTNLIKNSILWTRNCSCEPTTFLGLNSIPYSHWNFSFISSLPSPSCTRKVQKIHFLIQQKRNHIVFIAGQIALGRSQILCRETRPILFTAVPTEKSCNSKFEDYPSLIFQELLQHRNCVL